MLRLLLLSLAVPTALAGPGDTVEDVRVAFSNVPVSEQALHEPVTVESGSLPTWISGSLVRHACGAFGETGSISTDINKIDHLFDCIYTAQSYHFHQGKATFSNQFWDTNQLQVWKKYNENMNKSSVWFGTTYAEFNITAREAEKDDMNDPERPSHLPTVAWWKLGMVAIELLDFYIINFNLENKFNA